MVYDPEASALRHQVSVALLAASLMVVLPAAPLPAELAEPPIRALERYPYLADFFAFGFWHPLAPHDKLLSGDFGESTYATRWDKLLHHFARNHVNTVITANQFATADYLAAAGKYGIGQVSSAQFLHSYVKHSGELTGEVTLEQELRNLVIHAEDVRDDPNLIGYVIYDEPRPAVAPLIRQFMAQARKTDPNHPPIFTQQDMPLDRLKNPAEWQLIGELDVLLSDCYAFAAHCGRDPWLYGDVYIPEMRRANPDGLNWPIVSAFSKVYTIWALPTPAELRVQVYHTIAAGAKGMFFFTSNQGFLGAWSRRHWFWRGAGNPWFGREELMEEIGHIGKHLTTAGPLLLPLRYAPDYPAWVGAADSPSDPPPTFQAYLQDASGQFATYLRQNSEIQRPAIHVGAFGGGDYDVLVVHNDDPWASQSAAVTLAKQPENVLDLLTLERVPLKRSAGGVTFAVRFKPGDGRLYLVGDDAAVEAGRAHVLQRRYEHAALLLQRDAEIAGRGGVEIAATEQAMQRAAAAAEAGDPAAAVEKIEQARAAFGEAENAAREYSDVRSNLERARACFDQIHDWFYSAPYFPSEGAGGVALDRLGETIIDRSVSFTRVENAFRAGRLNVEQGFVMHRETQQYMEQVLAFRPENLTQGRVAVVELVGQAAENDRPPADPEAGALAKRLRWMYTDVVHVKALADGRFTDADGDAIDLGDYDVVWLHVGGRSSAAHARYCVSATLAPGVPQASTITSLRKFIDAGGGMVLSGLAAQLVQNLGLEAYPPNHCYWGSMIVPGHGPSRHRSEVVPKIKALGLKPFAPDHPLFAGLPADGFETMEFNPPELVTEVVWQRPPGGSEAWRSPSWPENGQVLAGYWADGIEIPTDYAAAVAYETDGGSKVLMLGGAFDPRVSTNRPRRGEHYDQLIRNAVAWCSGQQTGAGEAMPTDAMREQVIETEQGRVHVTSLLAWRFAVDEKKRGMSDKWYAEDFDDSKWGQVRTDLNEGWQAQGFDDGDEDAFGWYRLRIKTPAEFAGKKLYLVFEAVDEDTHVYVNGIKAFEHSCDSTGLKPVAIWTTPFAFEAGRLLNANEENLLAVGVYNRAGMGGVYRPVSIVAADVELDLQTLLEMVRR